MNSFQAMFKYKLQLRLRSIAERLDAIDDSDFLDLEPLLLELVDPLVIVDRELLIRGLDAE
jgi:hypothetical protein